LIKDSSAEIDYLWERAVLSKGMYFIKTTAADKWNMLSTRLSKNNIERDYSWRRLLRISVTRETDWENRQGFVKSVFDDSRFDINNIESSLRRICEEALTDSAIEDWRKLFITYSDLFKDCNQGFIVKNDSEIILLYESQLNHHHSELYTRILDIELKQKSNQLTPFKQLPYEPVRSTEKSAYVALKEGRYAINIRYFNHKYELRFYAIQPQEYSEALISILEKHEFESSNNYQDTSYLYYCITSEMVFVMLRELCSDLRVLDSELGSI
jgi:hypothetical protein